MSASRIRIGIVCAAFIMQCVSAPSAGPEKNDSAAVEYSELAELQMCCEVLRHLYRWYLDEADIETLLHGEYIAFHLLPVKHRLDEGDQSLYADLTIHSLGVLVQLKKTDYFIEELDVHVRSDRFKIVNVKRIDKDRIISEQTRTIQHPRAEIMAYLFRTRHQADPPAPELRARLINAVKEQAGSWLAKLPPGDSLTVFVSPLSPVANEAWAFVHDAKLLIRWASDINLNNPALWEKEHLSVEVIDIEKQAILSFSEAPGSNAFMSRDQVGRIIYICTVLGKKALIPRKAP